MPSCCRRRLGTRRCARISLPCVRRLRHDCLARVSWGLFFVGVGLGLRLRGKLFLDHLGLLARLHFLGGAGLDFLVEMLLLLLHALVVHFVAWVSHCGLSIEWLMPPPCPAQPWRAAIEGRKCESCDVLRALLRRAAVCFHRHATPSPPLPFHAGRRRCCPILRQTETCPPAQPRRPRWRSPHCPG